MSDNKKYFWLKLQKTFYSDVRIKKLRKIAGGDTYTIIYQKLLLETIASNGILNLQNVFEDPTEEIALLLDEDFDNVKACLGLLRNLKLCEVDNEDNLFFIQAVENTGKETDKASLMRDLRKRVTFGNNVTQVLPNVTNCYTEIESDKELELELELDKTQENTNTNSFHSYAHPYEVDPDFYHAQIVEACVSLGFTVSTLSDIPTFKEQKYYDILIQSLSTACYDIYACIKMASYETRKAIQEGNKKPLYTFQDLLYSYLKNGRNGINRIYTSAELEEKRLAKEKRELGQKELEQEETRASALEIARYEQETAMLFDIEIGDVEAFSQKYEGGMIAFFDERRQREEVKINTPAQTWGVPEEVGVAK